MAEKDNKPKATTASTPVKPTVKPAATVKPTVTAKPAATAKPTVATKPTAAAKPEVKPIARTTAAAQPTSKPASAVKPAATSSAAKPTVKPTMSTQTAGAYKPVSTVKPTTSAQSAAKSTAAVKPTATATTAASRPEVKPVAKSTISAPPTVATKPAATQAAATAKPAASAKPDVKPAAKPTTSAQSTVAATARTAVNTSASRSVAKPAGRSAPATAAQKSNRAAAIFEKLEKPNKQAKEKPAKATKNTKDSVGGSSVMARAAAMVKTRNFKIAVITVLATVLVLGIMLGIIFGVKGCSSDPANNGGLNVASVSESHRNKTQVGYSGEIVGTADRYKPVEGVHDEGLSSKGYPKYGSTLNLTTDEKTTLIQENRKLTANGTWVDASKRTTGTYDKMDKDGYLYKLDGSKPDAGVPERLYKHTGSVGLYGGNVADDEPAVVKNLTIRPRSYGNYYSVTGLYAPAGEVIKIQLTDADMTATSGLTIHIGQALYNGQANNIWEQRGVNRMPVILNTMNITKETATYDEETGLWTGYVGSFLGGPIYVRSESYTFSVTISGGVNYAHFILGVTTEAEYEVYSKSSAPYFDLEVWDRGVLHSGPKRAAKNFGYNDLYKAAVLWEKISLVTTSVSNQGIVFLYDPFVAAGAAVAFPGRRSVNCPEGWMSGSLNYSAFVTSGSWGNMHEYHHNFQGYGLGSGADGEVTNNGLNLVSYSLFTKVSASRQPAGYGGSGLSGWNQYTSAPWALQRVNSKAISSTNGLAIYATLLHNLGQDEYTKARGANGVTNYFNRWATNTHQDFTYYANLVKDYGGGTYAPSDAVKNANYPLFVPVSSVYQTGRTYNYDGEKREINTMQPYVIPYGKSFKVDLRDYEEYRDSNNRFNGQYKQGSIVIANGFKCSIKSVKADGINGTFVKSDEDGVYTFTPNSELRSGKIYVTLEITTDTGAHEWNGHKLDDVDLVLEFQQSHESNKAVLERTTYFYTAETAYTDARAAYEKNYAGYESKNDRDHSNPTQNCNTDIWYCTEGTISRFPNANPELAIVKPYSIDELRGKLYFSEAGTYNIYLRGRRNCALYYSLDGGKTYQLGTYIADSETGSGWRTDKFVKLENLPAESWVYFKEVLINEQISSGMTSFIGLGYGQWTVPMYTSEMKYYTQVNGAQKELAQETENGETRYYYTQGGTKVYVDNSSVTASIVYKNSSGQVVSAEEAANTDLIAPTTINYATAYRQSYEFQKAFESDYFYVRTYTYSYSDVAVPSENAAILETKNVEAYGDSPFINMLYENGLTGTGKFQAKSWVSTSPFEISVDMGHEVTANRIDLYGTLYNGNSYHPTKFYVLVGTSPDEITTPFGQHWENVKSTNGNVAFSIEEALTFRYYKIVVEAWSFGAPQFRYVKFSNVIPGTATMYSPDDAQFTYKGAWQIAQTNASFGHVYLGKAGSEVSFEFEAKDENSRFGVLTSNKYGQNFEVYIDGIKVDTEKLKDDKNETALRYLTPKLSQGKHKVTIKCTGEANFDSFILY